MHPRTPNHKHSAIAANDLQKGQSMFFFRSGRLVSGPAALEGMKSLTEYVVRLIERDAKRVIKEHAAMILKDDVFDRFMTACKAADAPNKKLREAREFAREKGISW